MLERAFSEDRIFVTKNIGDFEKLAKGASYMPGSSSSSKGISPEKSNST